MNHDATHCADWRESCPKDCRRGLLTEDLKRRHDLTAIPMSWAEFRGTAYCPLRDTPPGQERN